MPANIKNNINKTVQTTIAIYFLFQLIFFNSLYFKNTVYLLFKYKQLSGDLRKAPQIASNIF